MIIAFDRDATLEGFGGPILWVKLRRLQDMGHIIGTGGADTGENQAQQWEAAGVQPSFRLTKRDLWKLREMYPAAKVLQVDDDWQQAFVAHSEGRAFLTPGELWELLVQYI